MKRRRILLFGLVVVALAVAAALLARQRAEPQMQARVVAPAAASAEGFVRAEGPAELSFPADFGPHPGYQTEWWYYTGNLKTVEGRHFGYQFTIFRRASLPPGERSQRSSDWATEQIYMGHFAVTDAAGQRYQSFERFARGAAGLAGGQAEPYRVWLEDWQIEQVDPAEPAVTRMTARAGDMAIDLVLNDVKGPVLHGERGYSQKGPDPGNASYYYSQTRLETGGMVRIGRETFQVSGLSWKDHEYSTSALASDQVGWDWFALQLDDGSELKVFHIRKADGDVDPFSAGSFIDDAGNVTHLNRDDFSIEILDRWRSPRSGGDYPAGWRVAAPSLGIDLTIEPWLADQELNVSYNYWEGAVKFTGQRAGQLVSGNGYVELTGYSGSMQGQF